jgi:molybdopterin converting factor small subunit
MKEELTPSLSQSSEGQETSFAYVKVLGSIGKTAEGKKLNSVSIKAPLKVGELLDCLTKSYGLDLRRDSTLVLVNGVEANALDDLETVVQAGDRVDLVPMFHGGS